jgi:hypothetical protein
LIAFGLGASQFRPAAVRLRIASCRVPQALFVTTPIDGPAHQAVEHPGIEEVPNEMGPDRDGSAGGTINRSSHERRTSCPPGRARLRWTRNSPKSATKHTTPNAGTWPIEPLWMPRCASADSTTKPTIKPGLPSASKRDQGCKQKREAAKLIGALAPKAWPVKHVRREHARPPWQASNLGIPWIDRKSHCSRSRQSKARDGERVA